MMASTQRRLPRDRTSALIFVALLLVADISLGLDLGPPVADPDAADPAERVWEGGGSSLAFVDSMDSSLAHYMEQMDPLPDGRPFDYYGGAVPQPEPGERPTLWGPGRWQHEWWRWGEESAQRSDTAADPLGDDIDAWHSTEALGGSIRFGDADAGTYPGSTFSGLVSPVVDLRSVEAVQRGEEVQVDVPPHYSSGSVVGAREQAAQNVSRTGVAELTQSDATATTRTLHSAAALRLRHAYDFVALDSMLRDGARVEASRLDPVHGWIDWQPLRTSADVLRVGGEEFEGRFSLPIEGIQGFGAVGAGARGSTGGPDDSAQATPEAYVDGSVDNPTQGYPDRSWLYQGVIDASSVDRSGPWQGFGGSSGGAVESVFDLNDYAGSVVRLRFVVATGGSAEQPNFGGGWLLDQLEVHALGEPSVEVIAPVLPTEGALLHPSAASRHPVLALQNSHSREVTVHVHTAVAGATGGVASTDRLTLPAGPWGRVFYQSPHPLSEMIGSDASGMKRLAVRLTEMADAELAGPAGLAADAATDLLPARPPIQGFYHFQFGGPSTWEAVRVTTEAIPLPGDETTRPGDRDVLRNQHVRVHVDLRNLGPNEIPLDFSDPSAPPLRPLLVDVLGNEVGDFTFLPEAGSADGDETLTLPASRDASGSLGIVDADQTAVWKWSGSPSATLLNLFVERDGERVMDGGVIRVETMQPTALDADMSNLWDYNEACRREAEAAGRTGVLACRDGEIASPMVPFFSADLRRGDTAHLFLVHRGAAGNITLQVDGSPPSDTALPAEPQWNNVSTVLIPASQAWMIAQQDLGTLQDGGWMRAVVEGSSDLLVDELRIEVGPSDRRLPLLWETLDAELVPETSGSLRSAEPGGRLAVLGGAALRPGDQVVDPMECGEVEMVPFSEQFIFPFVDCRGQQGLSCDAFVVTCSYQDDEFTTKEGFLPGGLTSSERLLLQADAGVPGTAILQLPDWYDLTGARPTLSFRHHLSASASARGTVEVGTFPDVDAATWQRIDDARQAVRENWTQVEGLRGTERERVEQVWEELDAALWSAVLDLLDHDNQTRELVQGVMSEWNATRDALWSDLWGGVEENRSSIAALEQTMWTILSLAVYETLQADVEWTPATTFHAPRREQVASMEDVSVPLWQYAGERVLLRFGYEYDAARQPALAPLGWVLDDVRLEQTLPGGVERIDPSDGNFTGYQAYDVRFRGVVQGTPREDPERKTSSFRFESYPDGGRLVGASCTSWTRPDTYAIGPSIITDPLDLRAMNQPVLVLEHGGAFNNVGDPGKDHPYTGTRIFDIEFQLLQVDGRWSPWQRATPHTTWDGHPVQRVDGGPQWEGKPLREQGYLPGLGDEDFVKSPFSDPRWAEEYKTQGGILYASQGPIYLTGDTATVFDLSGSGRPAGEIVRFRFHVWEEHNGNTQIGDGNCPPFEWDVFSMKVFENRHIFDADLRDITLLTDDQEMLDRAPGAAGLAGTPAVAGDLVDVRVGLRNAGDRAHAANVTLSLLDGSNQPVQAAIDFISDAGPTGLAYGILDMATGAQRNASFVVDFGSVPPGTYTFRAVVDLDDALDTNSRNDVVTQTVRVVPVRSLDIEPGASVAPLVGPPEDARRLDVVVRNQGNIGEQEVTARAKVVEIAELGREKDLIQGGYWLDDRTMGLSARHGEAKQGWDLEDDGPGGLSSLLEAGKRYAVNVTLTPAEDSAKAWWTSPGIVPLDPSDETHHFVDISGPGTACGCYRFPFFAEALLAESDLTDGGTQAVLDGYLDGVADAWETTTRFREDGQWVEAKDDDHRSDLPSWTVVDREAAGAAVGALGTGNAWHLPAYDGFEPIEHTLTSPPLPGHVVNTTSQTYLALRYANGVEDPDQARLEVRTLQPGGMSWGPWHPIDQLAAHRVAVVVPPDYPLVFSTASVQDAAPGGKHPIPPFYKPTAVEGTNNIDTHTWKQPGPDAEAHNHRFIACDCRSYKWSPYPLYHGPDAPATNQSRQALAQVLGDLADAIGPGNVGIFTTGIGNASSKFAAPSPWMTDRLGQDHIEYDTVSSDGSLQAPLLRVSTSQTVQGHYELPVNDVEVLAGRLQTYRALLLVGDGMTRVQDDLLDDYSFVPPEAEENLGNDAQGTSRHVTLPSDVMAGRAEEKQILQDHFEQVQGILRAAPASGVRVLGALGPATAALGASGVADGVHLSTWGPGSGGAHCLLESPDGEQFTADLGPNGPQNQYKIQVDHQPKDQCLETPEFRAAPPGSPPRASTANYRYFTAAGMQQAVLNSLLASGGASWTDSQVLQLQPKGDVTFITQGQESAHEDWVQTVLEALVTDNRIPPNNAEGWTDLPLGMGTPVGGSFARSVDGSERFVGETMQFRITVKSDPLLGGHGPFLLDAFRLLGTPEENPDLEVRFAEPSPGDHVREPGERDFYVTVEVINRGLDGAGGSSLTVELEQDCPNVTDCIPGLHKNTGGPEERTVGVGVVSGGARRVLTLGPAEHVKEPTSGAPSGITYAAVNSPFVNGIFPTQGTRFILNANLTNGPPHADPFMARNDAAQLFVASGVQVSSLVKYPPQDIQITPTWALQAGPPGGTSPSIDGMEVRARLTNDGSRTLLGAVSVTASHATSHDCFDNVGNRFYACRGDGTKLGFIGTLASSGGFLVERGTTLEHVLPVDAAADLGPGVYRVTVTVTTTDPFDHSTVASDSVTRWVYVAESRQAGPNAFYQEDLATLQHVPSDDAEEGRIFPGDDTDPVEPPFFAVAGHTQCREDTNTTDSTARRSGDPMLHGWRVSDQDGDACAGFRDPTSHALQWVRETAATTLVGASWSNPSPPTGGTTSSTPEDEGFGDFGPDAIVWHPTHDRDAIESGPGAVNGGFETLARFAPGGAVLSLDTRFKATDHTAYVVEMQVAARQCQSGDDSGTGLTCDWVWDWGQGDGQHWLALRPTDLDSTPAVPVEDRKTQPILCKPANNTGGVSSPPTNCWRNSNVTNPLGGLPGIWGGSSADLPTADASGWTFVKYPIDSDHQQGLSGYCGTVANRDINTGGNAPAGVPGCMYAGTDGGNVPRPVAFRLRAASFGGDEGNNVWQVRNISLTAHDLAVDGRIRFPADLQDGQSRAVPVAVRNDGAVDEVVEVTATPLSLSTAVDVGVSRHTLAEPTDGLVLRIPAGAVRTVWVHVDAPLGAGGLFASPDPYKIPVQVEIYSLLSDEARLNAYVDVSLQVLKRSDLVIGTMAVDGSTVGLVHASQGVPIHVTLRVRNQGTSEVDGDRLHVRLVARQVDPDNVQNILHSKIVSNYTLEAPEVAALGTNCRSSGCSIPVPLDWTPDGMGVFDLVAEVNKPGPDDEAPRVRESNFANNDFARRVVVGPVPFADLRVDEVHVVRFAGSCESVEDAVTRLVAGHDYCVAAAVSNQGSRPALNPEVEFRVGASSPFSRGQERLPLVMEPQSSEWVFSSPVTARLPNDVTDGGERIMPFKVSVNTDSQGPSVAAQEISLDMPVDGYALQVLDTSVHELVIPPGAEAIVEMRLRNQGTAVATPVISQEVLPTGLRVILTQPAPMQPGEHADITFSLHAPLSAAEGIHDATVVLATVEDPKAVASVPLRINVTTDAAVRAEALPLTSGPGNAFLQVVLDNTAWAREGTWVPLDATAPLVVADNATAIDVEGHGIEAHEVPVVIPAITPPGMHSGVMRFRVDHGSTGAVIESTYTVHVLSAPSVTISLGETQQVVIRGSHAEFPLNIANVGNRPVEILVEHNPDHGVVEWDDRRIHLSPGQNLTASFSVRGAQAERTLGNTTAQWRVPGEPEWRTMEEILWTVHHVPASVRIRTTDLQEVDLAPGTTQVVRASLINPTHESVDAEALLVVDGLLQSRQRVDLPPNSVQAVQLPVRIEGAVPHIVQVVVRPSGSDVGLSDPLFHAVGDVEVREWEPTEEDGPGALPVPAPHLLAGLGVLLGLAVVLRRRRSP